MEIVGSRRFNTNMSFRQKAGDGKGNVCNMVDIYCSATNRFLNLFIFGQATETIFSSSWTRAPELLTAKSALACVQVPLQVPRGDIF